MRLYLTNALSPLLDTGFIEGVLLDHFRPLLDPHFDQILASAYPDGVRFLVNGRELPRTVPEPGRTAIVVRVGRQRKASGMGYVLNDLDIADQDRGMAISTLGKVIKRGWDWLGLAPGEATSVTGLIEVPALAEVLTLNKADFIRTGQKGATFLAYRKAIQEPVARLLVEWGNTPRPSPLGLAPAADTVVGAGPAVRSGRSLGRFSADRYTRGAPSRRSASASLGGTGVARQGRHTRARGRPRSGPRRSHAVNGRHIAVPRRGVRPGNRAAEVRG